MKGFAREITNDEIKRLKDLSRQCRGDIIKMTTIAGSGHPGGSMSSVDIYLLLYSFADISPKNFDDPRRDRVIVSHGHTSPGLYTSLARLGFVDREDVLTSFRLIDSPYEGHCERHVPGVEWSTGNLGQGLSAGCGFALASKLGAVRFQTFVVMSDAEQAKGQVAEARRFARKYNLNDLTVIIDYNHTQISGCTDEVMPVRIKENYLADGWRVLEVPGHDFSELHRAIRTALADSQNPYVIICLTTIGHGVSFMENKAEYHGRVLNRDECRRALGELGVEDDLDDLTKKRGKKRPRIDKRKPAFLPLLKTGTPKLYNEAAHPRAVFGEVMEELGRLNQENPIAVFDCDLCESVRVDKFARQFPKNFFEAGVSEHTTATIAGALSINGVVSIWADFGVFAIDEVYNQLRLNDINQTNIKIVATHLGYNVGPDGKTHHCIDYIGLLRNLFGFGLVIPGDPNQTDRIVRHILTQPGNYVIGLIRTKMPIIKDDHGKPFFDDTYQYQYGKIDTIREGRDGVIFTCGPMLENAVSAWEGLKVSNIAVRICNVTSPLRIDRGVVIEAARTGLIITYEDHCVQSGLGSIIGQIIAQEGIRTNFVNLGIDQYGPSDNHDVLYKKYLLDCDSLIKRIKENLAA